MHAVRVRPSAVFILMDEKKKKKIPIVAQLDGGREILRAKARCCFLKPNPGSSSLQFHSRPPWRSVGWQPPALREVLRCAMLRFEMPLFHQINLWLKGFAVLLLCQSPCKSSRDQNRRLSAVPSLINRRCAAEQPPARRSSMEHPRTVCRRRHVCWICTFLGFGNF